MKGRSHHASTTHGQWIGHLFRRCVHLAMAAIPFLYYPYVGLLAKWMHLNVSVLLTLCLALIVILEYLRLRFKLVIFGQRQHERTTISSFAWGAFSIVLVLWFSPAREYSIAIIVSCALGDPLLGELRSRIQRRWLASSLGLLAVLFVWLFCAIGFGFSIYLATLAAMLTVLAEGVYIKWIDDNALMLLVPLLTVITLTALGVY